MKQDELKPSLKANTIISFIIQLITYVTPLVCSPYLSRVLGAEGIGAYSFAFSYAHYFLLFAAFGFTDFGSRLISKNRTDLEKRNRLFWSVIFVRSLFVLVSLIVYFSLIFGNVFAKVTDRNLLYALALIIITPLFDTIFFFRGIEKFKFISYSTAAVNLIYIIFIFTLVKNTNDLLMYTILKSGVSLFISLSLWIFAIPRISKPKLDKDEFIPILKGGLMFFLPTLVMSISGSIDQTLIGLFNDNVQVAYYQQSTKITSLIFSISYAFSPIVLSRISLLKNDNEANKEEIREVISKALSLSLFLVIPILSGLYIVAHQFIPAYFGDEFTSAVPTFYAVLPVCVFSSLSSILINSCYYPSGKTTKVTIIIGLSVIFNIALTSVLLLITPLGAIGAAIASSIGELMTVILLLVFAKKEISLKSIGNNIWKIFLSTALMISMLLIVNYLFIFKYYKDIPGILFVVIDALIGVVVYLLMCLILKEKVFYSAINLIRDKLKWRSK